MQVINSPCIDCFNKKKKVFFDIEKARKEAGKKAVEEGETFALYKKGNQIEYAPASEEADRVADGYKCIEMVSKYL